MLSTGIHHYFGQDISLEWYMRLTLVAGASTNTRRLPTPTKHTHLTTCTQPDLVKLLNVCSEVVMKGSCVSGGWLHPRESIRSVKLRACGAADG